MSNSKAIARAAVAPRSASVEAPLVATSKAPAARTAVPSSDATQLYGFAPQVRIAVIRRGIPASVIGNLSSRMGMSKETLLSSLGLSRATISRKERDASVLSRDESERVLGVESLIGMVQTMVSQSGDPAGFDAARWVSAWLTKPLPALAGETPASYMDTFEGQKLVAELLSMSQSGAYA